MKKNNGPPGFSFKLELSAEYATIPNISDSFLKKSPMARKHCKKPTMKRNKKNEIIQMIVKNKDKDNWLTDETIKIHLEQSSVRFFIFNIERTN